MIKTVVKALEGFEKQFDEVSEMKLKLNDEKVFAKELALAKVEEEFAEKARKIDNVLGVISVTEEIEVPDEEVEPVVEEEVATEETECAEEITEEVVENAEVAEYFQE